MTTKVAISRKKNRLALDKYSILILLQFILHYHNIFRAADEDIEHHREGVVPMPKDGNGPGSNGKPYVVEHPDKDTQKLIDDGWSNNAFNQYVSDLISLHRTLPDPRDEW